VIVTYRGQRKRERERETETERAREDIENGRKRE
jgi:hypothetical protein